MEWFYKSDIMPSPEFLETSIVDMHPYYQRGSPEPSEQELNIKASLKNWFELNRQHKLIQNKILEIDDVNENSFFLIWVR